MARLSCRERWFPVWGNQRRSCWVKLRGGIDKDGYHKAILCRDGTRRYVRVHVLLLEVFRGPCPAGHVGAHNNGKIADNRITNLSWKTQAENIADKVIHGTMPRGSSHPQAKVTEAQVLDIRRRRAAGDSYGVLAAQFSLSKASVYGICARRTWSHLNG